MTNYTMYDVRVILPQDADGEYPVAVKGFEAPDAEHAESLMLTEIPEALAVWAIERERAWA